jgi:acyl-CoA synthetase (NDP forming)
MASRLITRALRRTVRAPIAEQTRQLNLHEYQSKALMQKYNVTVQKFRPAESAAEAEAAAKELSLF